MSVIVLLHDLFPQLSVLLVTSVSLQMLYDSVLISRLLNCVINPHFENSAVSGRRRLAQLFASMFQRLRIPLWIFNWIFWIDRCTLLSSICKPMNVGSCWKISTCVQSRTAQIFENTTSKWHFISQYHPPSFHQWPQTHFILISLAISLPYIST